MVCSFSSGVKGNFVRVVTLLVFVCLVGCGGDSGRPYTDHSQDPDAFARSVKVSVLTAVTEARKSEEPEDQVAEIVDFLEDLTGQPVGDLKEQYMAIASKAKEVREKCAADPKGRPSSLSSDLDELESMTEQLPGPGTAVMQVEDD